MIITKTLWLLLIATLLWAASSYGREEFAEKTGQDCEACHVDPSGGAELTDKGKGYLLSLRETDYSSGQSTAKKNGFSHLKTFRLTIGFIHIFTAFFWFGTILYVHLVLKPAYAAKGLPRGEIRVGLVSMAVIGITGAILTYYRVPNLEYLTATRFGILLLIKIGLFLFLVVSALFVVLFIGPKLSAKRPTDAVEPKGDMSLSQLAQFDGKEGRKAFIGYKGTIYDVSGSPMWKSGTHMVKHQAGEDLTEALGQAPHHAETLEKMTIIGKIITDEAKSTGLSHQHVFYFMAYLNLAVVIGVLLILSLWRWW